MLQGVRNIWYVYASEVPSLTEQYAMVQVPVISALRRKICITGESSLETNRSAENYGQATKAELNFKTSDTLPDDAPLAFIVQIQDGSFWLLGGYDAPYPLISTGRKFGAPDSDPNAIYIKVQHTNAIEVEII